MIRTNKQKTKKEGNKNTLINKYTINKTFTSFIMDKEPGWLNELGSWIT